MKHKQSLGLMAKCSFLLLFAGLFCVLLFFCLHSVGKQRLDTYFETSNFQEEQIKRRIDDLQTYVSKNQITTKEFGKLTHWVKNDPVILLEIYRNNILLYTSSAPSEFEKAENEIESPYERTRKSEK